MVNDMIILAIKWSDESRELRMAEDAFKDEPEWSAEGEPDQGEVMIIQKEKEKEKIKEKTAPKKKLNSKQHQLQRAQRKLRNSSARSDPLLLPPPSGSAQMSRLLQTIV